MDANDFSSQVRRLERELWDLLNEDGGGAVAEMLAITRRDARRGRMKRLLCDAIERSSLGCFAGKMYHFGGKVYVPIERFAFNKVIFTICSRRLNVEDADLVYMNDIYNDCSNVVFSKMLTMSANAMIFRNGVLDVDRERFYRHFDAQYRQLWAVDYDYEPRVGTYRWQKFLDEVLPDRYWQEALQMFLGATFVDRTKVKIEHIVILLGKGANGKSVIQQTVCGVLGEDYVSTMEIGRLCSRGIDGDMAVAEINGKRLNYCTEMEETDFYRKSARLKAIVSGENVTARHLYGNPFKALNVPLLMANANALPFFNKRDEAMLRRIYVIPFNVTIPEERQDKALADALAEEYPGILNWILDGRTKFIKNGYRLPADTSLRDFLDDCEKDFNSVLKFMDVHGYKKSQGADVIEPVLWRRLADLYADYFRWAKKNFMEEVVTKTVFSHILENYGFHKERRSCGIAFALFGNFDRRRKSMEKRLLYPERGDVRMLWLDGVPYLSNLKQMAEFAGVSIHVLRRLKTQGAFDAYIKRFKTKNCYQVTGFIDVLKRLNILATDEEKEAQKKMEKSLHRERNQFNARMKFRGLPYRKFVSKVDRLEEGIIVVSDFTTDEEALQMAAEAGYDVSGAKGLYYKRDHLIDDPDDEQKEMIEKAKEYEQQEESEE